jgi:hypothetical protein
VRLSSSDTGYRRQFEFFHQAALRSVLRITMHSTPYSVVCSCTFGRGFELNTKVHRTPDSFRRGCGGISTTYLRSTEYVLRILRQGWIPAPALGRSLSAIYTALLGWQTGGRFLREGTRTRGLEEVVTRSSGWTAGDERLTKTGRANITSRYSVLCRQLQPQLLF